MATVDSHRCILFVSLILIGSPLWFVHGFDAFYLGDCRNNICKQKCLNFADGFFCSCEDGYKLDKDGYSCSKPGQCPVIHEGQTRTCLEGCHSDEECPGSQKCCSNGCGRTCQNPNSLTIPTDRCSQKEDGGPCSNHSVKWYYDSQHGGCLQFLYGGCGGNKNRFETQIECENNCSKPVQPGGTDSIKDGGYQIVVEGDKSSNNQSAVDIVLSDQILPIKPLKDISNKNNNRTSNENTPLYQNKNSDTDRSTFDKNGGKIFTKNIDLKGNFSQPESDSLIHHGTGHIHGTDAKNSKLKPLALVHKVTCDGVVCQNNGTCVVEKTTTRCDCLLGFTGSRCERKIMVKYPKFTGKGYLALPTLKDSYKEFELNIEFMPLANNGLLLFSAELPDANKDFFSITLKNGFVEFRFDCGTGSAIIKSKGQVVIGDWNRVRAKRVNNEGTLWLNNEDAVQGVSKGAYSRITFRLHLFMGGYSNMDAISRRTGMEKPFVGCIQELIINEYKYDMRNVPLIGDAVRGINVGECSEGICESVVCQNDGSCVPVSADNYVCLCPVGIGGDNCQHRDVLVHIPEFSGHSYLKYPGLERTTLSFTEIELVFKPTNGEGIILYNGYMTDRKGDFLSVAMREGHLEFRFDLGTGPGIIRSLMPVTLNQWHWARVSRTGLLGVVEVDEQPKMEGKSRGAFTQLTLLQDLYLGGHDDFDKTSRYANLSYSFQGCIQKVVINNNPIKLLPDAIGGVNIQSCDHPCVGEPCMNSGECMPDKDIYTCYCPLGYTNSNCEDEIKQPVTTPMFSGQSFLTYTDRKISKRVSGSKIDIQMRIKSESPNGLIFWAGKDQPLSPSSDYMALGFVNGALQFRYNLGSGEAVISYNDSRLYDGKWHNIRAQRDKQDGYLEVDKTEIVEGSSPGSYTILNTNKVLYIGGLPDVPQMTLHKFKSGFSGCISRLMLAEDYEVPFMDIAQSGRNVKQCST